MTYARAALAGLVLLAVAGCTGGDPAGGDPSDDPPSSASSSATPSPTPTLAPPTIPPEAQEHSAQGAAAFVEYYVGMFNYAAESLETDGLAAVSSEGCGACQRIIDRLDRVKRNGGRSESPHWDPVVTSSQLLKGDFHVTLDVQADAYLYRESTAEPDGLVEATSYAFLVRLGWESGWVVERLAEQELPDDR